MPIKTTSGVQHDKMLQTMLRALSDPSRLTILRTLHGSEHKVGDVAQLVNLTEATVSHHLTRLREAGLITLRMDGTSRYYRSNPNGIDRFKRYVSTIEQTPDTTPPVTRDDAWIDALNWPAEDSQILRDHTLNGHIIYLPAKRKKFLVILRWIATLFNAEQRYTEAQVNEVLKAVYESDFVSLRRELVDYKYLLREKDGSRYWRNPSV